MIKTKRTSLGTFSCGPVKITITDDTIGLQLVEGQASAWRAWGRRRTTIR